MTTVTHLKILYLFNSTFHPQTRVTSLIHAFCHKNQVCVLKFAKNGIYINAINTYRSLVLLGMSFNDRNEVSPLHRSSTQSLNSLQSHFGCVRHFSPFPRTANIKRTRPSLSIFLASRRRKPLCKLQTMDCRRLLVKHIRHSWIDFLGLSL